MNLIFILVFSLLFFHFFCADIWFYCFHKLFHMNKFLYKNFHAQHHYYTEPFALSGIECHIIEHLLVNLGSAIIGPVILSFLFNNLSFTFCKLWSLSAAISTCLSHSGYKFFSDSHFNHHLYLKYNYGIEHNFSDRLFGTMYKPHNKLDKK